MRKGITALQWEQVKKLFSPEQQKQLLPIWNEANARVAAVVELDAKCDVLEALVLEMKRTGKTWATGMQNLECRVKN